MTAFALADGTSLQVVRRGDPAAPVTVAETLSSEAESQHVLLVDDHDGVRMTTTILLEELGYRVTAIPDGAQAVSLSEEELDDVDMLISDYAMPLMSGSEIIRQLRAKRSTVPAIIITCHADAIANIPDSVPVLNKPFTLAQLQQAIASVETQHAVAAAR